MSIQEVFEELVELEERKRAAALKAALLCSGYMVDLLETVAPGSTAKLAEHDPVPHQRYRQQIGKNVVSMRIVSPEAPLVPPRASDGEIEEMVAVGRWMVESAKLAYVTMCGVAPELRDFGLVVSKQTGDISFEKNPQHVLRMTAEVSRG